MVQRISNYQTPRRRETALPPRWVTPPRVIEKTPLAQFVILSMLLHVMFILVFGAPTGGSRDGRAMWGAFQVALHAPPRQPEPIPRLEPAPVPVPAARLAPPRPVEPSVAREIERTAVPEARPDPFAFPPLLDRIVTPERKLEMAPPLQLPKPVEAPPAPPPPEIPAPPVEATPPPVEVAAPVPIAPVPPVERAPIETPALPAVTPTPPVERQPVEVPALPTPRIETPTPRVEPAPKPVEAAPSQEIPMPPTIERVEPRLPPAARPAPVESPAKIAPSLPGDGREGLVPRRAEPSRDYDPTAPSIDLDAVRSRAGEIAREGIGRRGLLAFPMPALPERKSKMETAIENARKPDCRTAYQNLGLAAIVPLIANEFGEGRCRW